MNQIPDKLFRKLFIVSEQVRNDLKSKGRVIPVENSDGTVGVGHFTIAKPNNFYVILDFSGEPIVDFINLPQTAVIIANGLALGRSIDTQILKVDQCYGYAEFEEALHKRIAHQNINKDAERAHLMMTKGSINHTKKNYYRKQILRKYEKLIKFA